MPMFEVIHRQFDAESDKTDHLVFWVLAPDIDQVTRLAEPFGARVCELGLDVEQCIESIDYVLPREAKELRDMCKKDHE